jgi:hypothetical protein
MIDPKEIRVGNFVLKITGNDFNKNPFFQYKPVAIDEYFFTFAKVCFPIPLNAAILGNAGFKHAFGDWYKNREDSGVGDGLPLLRYRHKDNKWYLNEMQLPAQPRHLHQLQNLYHALTGDELLVNLEAFKNINAVGPINYFIKQPQKSLSIHGIL